MDKTSAHIIEELFYELIPAEDEAQLVIYVNGKKVVDVAGNIDPDAVTGIFSVSKALAVLAVAKLVDEGKIDLDKTVAHYWPEFAAQGKEKITVRQLLSHQAGLVETVKGLTIQELHSDHEAAALLAATKPAWEPGTAFGYHATTIGVLISELVFRVTGSTVQKYYENEIRSKVNADAYLGLEKAKQNKFRQPLSATRELPLPATGSMAEKAWGNFARAMQKSGGIDKYIFTEDRLEFGAPAFGGVASARGLAAIFNWATGYGAPEPGISKLTLKEFAATQVKGIDIAQQNNDRHHGIVFMKPTESCPFGSPSAFGHDGAGGSIVVADPENQTVLAYVVRRMTYPGGVDQRLFPIIEKMQEVF
ncbi:MAG: hypothetical protein RL129_160 [Actinomycetota bacterium]|jgi:CubicO group peptidase (beta-lactamase class C family)